MTAITTARPVAVQTGRRRPFRGRGRVRYVVLAVFALPWVALPLWLLLVNSLKSGGEASTPSIALPVHWAAIANYATVLTQGSYLTGLLNSVLLAVPAVILVLFLGSMAAWSYARSDSKALKFTYYVSSLSIILPPAIIPTVYILIEMGLNGTRIGYLLTIIGTRLGVIVFLSTGFVKTLPISLEEAALIDGASRWQVYWHVILPLLRPVLFSGAILLVINVWNDFFFALFLLPQQAQATLPLALYRFVSTSPTGIAWNLVFADVVLTGLPLLIVYLVLQRRVLAGLTEGSVTG